MKKNLKIKKCVEFSWILSLQDVLAVIQING